MTAKEVETACEQYNADPKNHDAQKELRRVMRGAGVLMLEGDKIDVGRTVKAWVYCDQTGASKVPSGKTADEVLQVVTGVLPASPYSGMALFEGMTPGGVDYGPVSHERRRWISFARLTDEPIGTEQEAVDAVLDPDNRHMQRIGKKLAELEAKPAKTADERRLLLDVDLRMEWTRDRVLPDARSTLPTQNDVSFVGEVGGPQVRQMLRHCLPTSTDLDAFVLDRFPAVFKNYGTGMDRTSRETLLLQRENHANVLAALRRAGHVR